MLSLPVVTFITFVIQLGPLYAAIDVVDPAMFWEGAKLALGLPFFCVFLPWVVDKLATTVFIRRLGAMLSASVHTTLRHIADTLPTADVVIVVSSIVCCWFYILHWTTATATLSSWKLAVPTRLAAADVIFTGGQVFLFGLKAQEYPRTSAAFRCILGSIAETLWCLDFLTYRPATLNPYEPTFQAVIVSVAMTLTGLMVFHKVVQQFKGQYFIQACFTLMIGAHIASGYGWFVVLQMIDLTQAQPKKNTMTTISNTRTEFGRDQESRRTTTTTTKND